MNYSNKSPVRKSLTSNGANKTIALVVGVLVMVFLINFIVLAWTEPGSPPPEGNVAVPIQMSLGNPQIDTSIHPSIWIKDTGGGDLIRLEIEEGIKFTVENTGNVILNGKLGIGTDNPGKKLDIVGDLRLTGGITLGGVTRTTWPSGGAGDITAVSAGTGLSGGGTSGDVTLNANTTYLQRRVSSTCEVGFSIRVINSDGTVSCQTDTSGSSLWSQNGSTIYYNAGNVGIGRTSSSYKLDISGDTRISTNLGVGTTPSSSYKIYSKGGSYGIRADGSTMGGYFRDSGGTSYTYIANSGYGIMSYGDTMGGYFYDKQETSRIYLAYSDYGIYQDVGSRNYFVGKVGIGTTNPDQKLHIVGTGYATGDFRAPIFYDTNNTSYYVNPAGTSKMKKLTIETIDPIFEIDGEKYATYVADFAGGVRMETSGIVKLENRKYVIDFDKLEKGSDLWLFWQTSNKNIEDISVLLTPSFEGKVWYEKHGNTITIYGEKPGEVSYRLSAPRLDYENWGNLAEDQNSEGIIVSNY